MNDMYSKSQSVLRRFIKDNSGATAVEYGLIIAILGVGLLVSIKGLGEQTANSFNSMANKIDAA